MSTVVKHQEVSPLMKVTLYIIRGVLAGKKIYKYHQGFTEKIKRAS